MNYKYAIIDSRLRKEEREYLISLGLELIEIEKSKNVYEEISSHVDIFVFKINDILILEPSIYDKINIPIHRIKGLNFVSSKYPKDVYYNACQIGNNVIHNFKYTDKAIIDVIEKEKLYKINIKQGYSNCSIAVIDDNNVIVQDKSIREDLKKNQIDSLLLKEKLDIKLLNNNSYSLMNGFIGGCMTKLDDTIIVFGDLSKIDNNKMIENYIKSLGLKIKDFKNLDVIDYGGMVFI